LNRLQTVAVNTFVGGDQLSGIVSTLGKLMKETYLMCLGTPEIQMVLICAPIWIEPMVERVLNCRVALLATPAAPRLNPDKFR
jgi:hypothetical protein